MRFIKTDDSTVRNNFRKAFYEMLRAPLDAMWEQLYINSAQDYLIENENESIGYCCIDDKSSLLQVFLREQDRFRMKKTIASLIESNLISSASLSSIEPVSFNACMFLSKSIKPNTFCFQYAGKESQHFKPINLEAVSGSDIPIVKAFFKEQIGFDDNFGYTENLAERKELFMYKSSDSLVATSECRLSDSQPGIADLGVIVNNKYRGKGIATQILHQQAEKVKNANLKPICSTTLDNIASRTAIERAGFYCSDIIFDIRLTNNKFQ